jgi:hypothetical protein
MGKEELKEIMGDFWKNLKRDSETNYIVCPDMNCDGFTKDRLQCTSSGTYFPGCPEKDKGFRVLHCHDGHPHKLPLDEGEWYRVNCKEKNCYSSSFKSMSGKYSKIPIELYDEFLEKEFVKK